jgi:hypothetical protein
MAGVAEVLMQTPARMGPGRTAARLCACAQGSSAGGGFTAALHLCSIASHYQIVFLPSFHLEFLIP